MYTFEQVALMLDDIVDALPDDIVCGLNGGIYLLPDTLRSNKIPDPHYFVLGEYRSHPIMGRMVYLYYGSIMAIYANVPEDELRRQLDKVVRHELRHHMESLAGDRSLEAEDERYIASALRKLGRAPREE